MYEHNGTIKTEIYLDFVPRLFSFSDVVRKVTYYANCVGISVTEDEVYRSISLQGLYKA